MDSHIADGPHSVPERTLTLDELKQVWAWLAQRHREIQLDDEGFPRDHPQRCGVCGERDNDHRPDCSTLR